jgi:tRNA (guanine37-N1)-methyltransferase
MWRSTIFTLFPEMFPGLLGQSLAGKALANGLWSLTPVDIRAFATDRHGTVDDTPFGGGAGMVMRADVVDAAIRSQPAETPLLMMSPRGTPLTQSLVEQLAQGPGCRILCGRYEGIDQRVIEAHGAMEVSVGDYVLSGGEPAAMIVLDACVRLLPGVLGNAATPDEESFVNGLLEYPHYTRPAMWTDAGGLERAVPEVLLSGNHGKVAEWRARQSLTITRERRPDLYKRHVELARETTYKGAPRGMPEGPEQG